MKLSVKQTVYNDNTAVFKVGDTVKLTTTSEEISGKVRSINISGSREIINLDCSREYDSKFVDVDLSIITNVEVL